MRPNDDAGPDLMTGNVPYDRARDLARWMQQYAHPYQELMSYYRCAIMEVETKFRVLNEDLSLRFSRNPIESISTRLKSPDSVMKKLIRREFPISVESIEENIFDIAGIRVICSFQSDIYLLERSLLSQDDVRLIQRKDYIANQKPNGYRSLHLIISIPIFLHAEKKEMKVEVQLRTLAMDLWASAEHKIRYKKECILSEADDLALLKCAETCAQLDRTLEEIYRHVQEAGSEAPAADGRG